MATRFKEKSDGSVSLPVLDHPAKSKRKIGPWRAGVLIMVYVLMAAHFVQWMIVGTTPLGLSAR